MRTAAKVDKNQPKIVEALRRTGATVIITSQLKNAFDILVLFQGNTFIVEVKDGDKPPSQKNLTEGELKCKAKVEKAGVKYWVIESIDDALEMIGV